MAKERPNVSAGSVEDPGRIQVRVSDFAHGLRVFDGVRLIRIKSSTYSLLIMEDYFPLVGSIEGTVELVTANDLIPLGKLTGFYVHRHNEFSLLIKEQHDEETEAEEAT